MLEMLTRIVTPEERDAPYITLAKPTHIHASGGIGGVELSRVSLAEFLWGDRRAGWDRDRTGWCQGRMRVDLLAQDGGFKRLVDYSRHMPNGMWIHFYWKSWPHRVAYLIGLEHTDGRTAWITTENHPLAYDLAVAIESSQLPNPKTSDEMVAAGEV